MSDKIKPSEVSDVLLQQLQEVNSGTQFDEVGTVLTVGDGVARIYGLRNAEASELLEFENGHDGHRDEPGGRQRRLRPLGIHGRH